MSCCRCSALTLLCWIWRPVTSRDLWHCHNRSQRWVMWVRADTRWHSLIHMQAFARMRAQISSLWLLLALLRCTQQQIKTLFASLATTKIDIKQKGTTGLQRGLMLMLWAYVSACMCDVLSVMNEVSDACWPDGERTHTTPQAHTHTHTPQIYSAVLSFNPFSV